MSVVVEHYDAQFEDSEAELERFRMYERKVSVLVRSV